MTLFAGILALGVTNVLSLVVDASDVPSYLMGEVSP